MVSTYAVRFEQLEAAFSILLSGTQFLRFAAHDGKERLTEFLQILALLQILGTASPDKRKEGRP